LEGINASRAKSDSTLTKVRNRSRSRDTHVRNGEKPGVPVLDSVHESFLVGESGLGSLCGYKSKDGESSLLSTEELGVVREIGEDEESARSDDD